MRDFLFLILLGIAVPASVCGQSLNFSDGFEDGDFTRSPAWSGDTASFSVILSDGNHLLQLDDSTSGQSYLSAESSGISGAWEFFMELDFPPSGSNNAYVFLMSDTSDLANGNPSGYALRAGETGSEDRVRLVRFDEGKESEVVLSGSTDISSGGPYRLRIQREPPGRWTLKVGNGYDGELLAQTGTFVDSTYQQSTHFGILLNYTSTRADKFFFDFKIDLPVIKADKVFPEENRLTVLFDRPYDPSSVQPDDFSVNNNTGIPESIDLSTSQAVTLNFSDTLTSDRYKLSISDITGTNGTVIDDSTTVPFIVFGQFKPGDILLNEFMYDPPSGQSEYLELVNRTEKILNLQHWKAGDDNRLTVISADTLAVDPLEHTVVTPDTTSLINTYGRIDNLHAISLPSLNNTGDAIRIIDSTGSTVDSLTYEPEWGGIDRALERRSLTTPSILKENWGDSPDTLGGTPGKPNKILPDTTAPSLINLEIPDNKTIRLLFSEPIESSSALSLSNYSLSGDISVAKIEGADSDSLRITLTPELRNDQSYRLTISNLRDLFGNTIQPVDTSFTFYEISEADSGDVVINEFMYDPPELYPEFIELYNRSDKSFDLSDWTINDRTGREARLIDIEQILPPKSYVVIAPDSTIAEIFPGLPLVTMASRFPVLNNSGDQIVLKRRDSLILDSLSYRKKWGGAGRSLERREGAITAKYRENWGDSPSPMRASPGLPNEIEKDLTAPGLDELSIDNEKKISLVFNERIKPPSKNGTIPFEIDNGSAISGFQYFEPDTILIHLKNPLQNAGNYRLAASGIEDIFGNISNRTDTTFTYYKISRADSGTVFINEFLADPSGGQSEFIELINTGSKSYSLKNWTINDNTGNRQPVALTAAVLPPDSFIVITPDRSLIDRYPNLNVVSMGQRFPTLNNGGDEIVVRNSEGMLMDSLQYTVSWLKSGLSIERRTRSVSGVFKENWDASPAISGSTPGAKNLVDPDRNPPEWVRFQIINDTLLSIEFDERLNPDPIDLPENFSLSNNIGVSGTTVHLPHTVFLHLDKQLRNNRQYQLTIENIEDIFGNRIPVTARSFTYYKISKPGPGDIFINEFMFDPPESFTEYVELYNRSEKSFDLTGWTLSDSRGVQKPVTSSSFVFPPDTFLVLVPDSTIANLFPDRITVTMGPRFPSLNNNSDDIVIKNENSLTLDSLRYTNSWGEAPGSLERRTIAVWGIYRENWGASPDSNGGTPGARNKIERDRSPPDLEVLQINDPRTVTLDFSERLSQKSIGESKFTFSGNIPVTDRQRESGSQIRLDLGENLENATTYNLSITGIADLFHNKISQIDTAFTYYEFSEPDSEDIVINEFLVQPPSGKTEYIELYNPSNKSFDLTHWTLNDNTGIDRTITRTPVVLPPDSFLVIAPDSTLYTTYPNMILVTMKSNFPSLNNTGDDIVIRDSSGKRLDSLTYQPGWGAIDIPLERRESNVPGTFRENWGNNQDKTGSPGSSNKIASDQSPPKLVRIDILSPSRLQLLFSETLDQNENIRKENITINPSIDIQVIESFKNVISLSLSKKLTSGTHYDITIRGIADIFGNRLETASKMIRFVELSTAKKYELIINEIMYSSRNSNVPEFIELFNPSARNFSLVNWTIGDKSTSASIKQDIIIESGKYLVLSGSRSFAESLENGVFLSNFPTLNDREDLLYIKSHTGKTIDSLIYRSDWGEQKGRSLERKDPRAASPDSSNWRSSKNKLGSTPGTKNSVFREDREPPDMIFASLLYNKRIKVYFDEFIQLTGDLQFSLGGESLPVAPGNPDRTNVVLLHHPGTVNATDNGQISARQIKDIRGNRKNTAKTTLTHPLQPGEVVINEIMFQPISIPDDNLPNQKEYVELRNISGRPVSLEGVSLRKPADENGVSRALKPVNTDLKKIPKNGVFLFYADTVQTFKDSDTAEYFELSNTSISSTARIDGNSLGLTSGNDSIILSDSTGETIDSIFYHENWHNANLMDTKGIALERINPRGASNDGSNWSSSVHSKGGTPASENSVFQLPANEPPDVGISFNPNPFSPDGDGHDDHLFINYRLDKPGYLATVRIYDRYGRLVRKLADGKPVGFRGSLTWDGTRDDRSRNRIGIYIVLFEAYDASSGNRKVFKEVAVLARKMQ